ncbi:MAG: acyl-CoA dehydrogenase family protein [Deltaproteobacteria bacterium]|nr:acyl-CoA dehydrogenase family protein [Deltaproteobacteria bacterium]MBW2363146.1 acyl-CoA dehydrogenase family protein [Deltaproteobacteria bacterium]
MDLEYGARYEAFRTQVRDFVAEHRPTRPLRLADGKRQERIAWLSLQIEHGYWARTIPREYGGYGAEPDLLETVIMDEEFNKAGVSRGMNAQGPSMLVPTLLSHGSEEQRRRWIGPTLRGEVLWCQGYSEPGAGSDLASLQTRATEDGDDFVINGQKIWTTTADRAEMCFILVRTEPDAGKHAGISYILLPMDTSGIEVQPLRTMSGGIGESSFNQVFFTDVRVPKANVVGKRGEGWKVANTTLAHERNSLNANAEGKLMRLARLMERETLGGVPAMASPIYRDRLMKLQARVLSMKHHGMRMLTCSLKGESLGVAGLVVKLQNCQLNFDMAALAIDAMGELGVLYDHTKYERERGYWQAHSMLSLGLIIGGGTAQIQKNIIAERGLGLPREPKPKQA